MALFRQFGSQRQADAEPCELQWALLNTVFGGPGSIVLASASMGLVGVVAFLRTGSFYPLLWSAAALLIMAVKLASFHLYAKRMEHPGPAVWRRRIVVIAWLSAACWGSMDVELLLEPDPFIHLLVVAAQCGYLMGTAARNSAVPEAVLGQVTLTMGPLFVATLAVRDLSYSVYSIFVLMFGATTIGFARQIGGNLHANIVAQQIVAEANRKLASAIAQTARTHADLREANARLTALVTTDGLTGLVNRRGFDGILEREWRRAQRESAVISCLMIDIDHFKKLNDSRGHPAGDECLRRIAKCLTREICRPTDMVARYGGEEFAVVLPGTNAATAMRVAEQLRAAIERLQMSHNDATHFVTASIGSATLLPTEHDEPGTIVSRADQGLYAAKLAGRNRVCAADTPADLLLSEVAD